MDEINNNRINIYRIKDPTLPDRELVKNYDMYLPFDRKHEKEAIEALNSYKPSMYYTQIPGVGTTYVRQTSEAPTRWSETFFRGFIQLQTKSIGAALVVRLNVDDESETFVIAFGNTGRFIVDPDAYDDRFGIRTALSAISSDHLKQISKNEFTGSNRITQQQISKGSNLTGFEIDPFGDYLKSVTGDASDPALSKAAIRGGANFSLSTEVDISNINNLLEEITRIYRSKAYKDNYAWIDNLYLVHDQTLNSKLFVKAIEQANRQDGSVWFAVPDMIDFNRVGFFRYLGSDHNDVELQELLKTKGESLTIKDLEKNVSARSAEDGRTMATWSLKKCLCGEVEDNGELYGTIDGKWFRIEKDFAKRVETEYKNVPISNAPLGSFKEQIDTKQINSNGKKVTVYSEGTYLTRIANENREEFVLMDQNLIHGIEVCDLVTASALIHVKRYQGSSPMSHAFFQGLNSASLLEEDNSYLNEANEKIAEVNADPIFQIDRQEKKDVVFAIIGKKDNNRPHLPFFSKISLCHTIKLLKGLGYECKITTVPIER